MPIYTAILLRLRMRSNAEFFMTLLRASNGQETNSSFAPSVCVRYNDYSKLYAQAGCFMSEFHMN
ncbi:hypothetical protein SIN01_05120 [Sporolactobacillus inulinus]|nr:hypothetical protein SIN01_05120 [Sporolactobacillus inulinus]